VDILKQGNRPTLVIVSERRLLHCHWGPTA